jgi:hypothetical protein
MERPARDRSIAGWCTCRRRRSRTRKEPIGGGYHRHVQEPGALLPRARGAGAVRLAVRLEHDRPGSGGRPAGRRVLRLVEALGALASLDAPVFTTAEAAARLRVPSGHASASLARLRAAGLLVCLRRGVWALPERVDPLALPEFLTAPFPAYVSLQSALYLREADRAALPAPPCRPPTGGAAGRAGRTERGREAARGQSGQVLNCALLEGARLKT